MAKELTPEQIENYKHLLEKEELNKEISHNQNVACATGAAIIGAPSAGLGFVFGAGVGAIPAGILGATGGCAIGMGAVDIYYKTGLHDLINTGSNLKDYLEKNLKTGDSGNIEPKLQRDLPAQALVNAKKSIS